MENSGETVTPATPYMGYRKIVEGPSFPTNIVSNLYESPQ
jgi:hypothetical protein